MLPWWFSFERCWGATTNDHRAALGARLLPWFENRQKELANRPLIWELAFGET